MLFLGVFSVGVNAKENSNDDIYVHHGVSIYYNTGLKKQDGIDVHSNDGTEQKKTVVMYPERKHFENGQGVTVSNKYILKSADDKPIITGTDPVTIRLNNFYFSTLIMDYDGAWAKYFNQPHRMWLFIRYANGTYGTFSADQTNYDYISGERFLNLNYTFTPSADIRSIEWYIECDYTESQVTYENSDYKLECLLGEHNGDNQFEVIIEQDTKEAGLLAGLIEWVKSIKETVTGGFSSIIHWFENIGHYLAELPNNIWTYIRDGLMSLFVPDEQFITEYKSKLDTMLENKLGAVYQFANITFESWDRIQNSDNTNTIDFPKATIKFGNTSFSFGGYQVKIVPDGFDFLVTAIKTIIGILCTIAFVNGMRKRYDEVMGEQ